MAGLVSESLPVRGTCLCSSGIPASKVKRKGIVLIIPQPHAPTPAHLNKKEEKKNTINGKHLGERDYLLGPIQWRQTLSGPERQTCPSAWGSLAIQLK